MIGSPCSVIVIPLLSECRRNQQPDRVGFALPSRLLSHASLTRSGSALTSSVHAWRADLHPKPAREIEERVQRSVTSSWPISFASIGQLGILAHIADSRSLAPCTAVCRGFLGKTSPDGSMASQADDSLRVAMIPRGEVG